MNTKKMISAAISLAMLFGTISTTNTFSPTDSFALNSYEFRSTGTDNSSESTEFETPTYGSIHVSTLPNKLVYNIGEELDISGGKAYGSGVWYKYGVETEPASWDITEAQSLDSEYFVVDSSDFDNTKAGTYEIIVSLAVAPNITDSFKVIVTDEATTHETYKFVEVKEYPEKVIYEKGSELDLSGLKFTGEPRSGSGSMREYTDSDLDDSAHCKIEILKGYGGGTSYSPSEFSTLPSGYYTVHIKGEVGDYYSYDLCYDVDISYEIIISKYPEYAPYPAQSFHGGSAFIEVVSYPDKSVYTVGEKLDLSGLEFIGENILSDGQYMTYTTAEFNRDFDDDSHNIKVYNAIDRYASISIVDKEGNSIRYDLPVAGEYTVHITGTAGEKDGYNHCYGLDISFPITVIDASAESITTTTTTSTTQSSTPQSTTTTATTSSSTQTSLNTHPIYQFEKVISYPTKTVYNCGEELDFSGLEFIGYYGTASQTYDDRYIRRDYWVEKKVVEVDGTSHDYKEFPSLPAGDYKVSILGNYYSDGGYNSCRGIDISYMITIHDDYPMETTHVTYKFDKVISYPTQTVYSCGQELDLSGLELTGVSKRGETFTYNTYDGDYYSYKLSVKITDDEGNSYRTEDFSDLPVGEYTVNLTGSVGDYYHYNLCNDVEISYNVTITEGGSSTGTTTKNKKGDANCDGKVSVADAVAILQSIGNPDKFELNTQGRVNADVDGIVGITANDALMIKKYDAGVISELS